MKIISIKVSKETHEQWKRLCKYKSVSGREMIEKIIKSEADDMYSSCYILYGYVSPDDYSPDE